MAYGGSHHAGARSPRTIGGDMIRSIALGIAVVLSAATLAIAQTQEEQDACKDDAMRVCGDAIPDRDQVYACLVRKVSTLSAPCKSIITASIRGNRRSAR